MSDSRVLVTTYPVVFPHRGSGELELVDLLATLRQLGACVDLYGPTAQHLSKCEVLLHRLAAWSRIALGIRRVVPPSLLASRTQAFQYNGRSGEFGCVSVGGWRI